MTSVPEKMTGTSLDIASDKRAQLKQLFPTAFTETVNAKGEVVESVDFERLKAELGTFTDLFENRRERYGMDWPGKKEALKLIQGPEYRHPETLQGGVGALRYHRKPVHRG